MRNMYFTWIILPWLAAAHIADVAGFILDDNSGQCDYHESQTTTGNTDCDSRGLREVPIFNETRIRCSPGISIYEINLNRNQICLIPDNSFIGFKRLHCSVNITLNLSQNNISNIMDSAFNEIEGNVTRLLLENNNLRTIPDGVGQLYRLSELNILDNPLQTLDPQVMANLGRTLKVLELHMASMQTWPTQLRFLRALESLRILNIPFTRLVQSAFHGLSQLTYLYIENSSLHTMPAAICELKKLQVMVMLRNYNLNQSKWSAFEECGNNKTSLDTLAFNFNSVDYFPNMMSMFKSINHVDMSYNDIQYMNEDQFQQDFSTTYLSSGFNHFTRIPSGLHVFHNLTTLALTQNRISQISDYDLKGLTQLKYLELLWNPIRFITRNAFQDNTLLSELNLHGTLLSEIPVAVTTLPLLTTLILTRSLHRMHM